MKLINRINIKLEGLIQAVIRFPLTVVFLLALVVLNSIMINAPKPELEKLLVTMVVGAFFSIDFQMIYERFNLHKRYRLIFYIASILMTLIYFILYGNFSEINQEVIVRTVVIALALVFGFIWIPSIKNEITFNQTFLASFKSFFISLFFSSVIFFGLTLIYGATDQLLLPLSEKIYAHTANIVFLMFATIYFLSLIPKYSGKNLEEINKATSCPKFLEILLSYIIVPLTSIFTLILLIYIATNVRGSFWEDDLLEVMLVSYIIVVILIYILVSNVDNRFTEIFRKVFPKILVVIVLFQTINSIMRMGDYGITYGRYYVILFGIFALITGIWFSIKPVEKNGIVPLVLLVCILVSMMPFVDAFKLSEKSQRALLEEELIKNEMLIDGKIIPNENLDLSTKKKITYAVTYLYRMDYQDDISWLPKDFMDFEEIFGFDPYIYDRQIEGEDIHIYPKEDEALNIAGFDYLINLYVGYEKGNDFSETEYEIVHEGSKYIIKLDYRDDDVYVLIKDEKEKNLMEISGRDLTKDLRENYEAGQELNMADSRVEFTSEEFNITAMFKYLDMSSGGESYRFDGELILLIDFN